MDWISICCGERRLSPTNHSTRHGLDVSHRNSADSPKLHTHSSRSFVNVTGVAKRNYERF